MAFTEIRVGVDESRKTFDEVMAKERITVIAIDTCPYCQKVYQAFKQSKLDGVTWVNCDQGSSFYKEFGQSISGIKTVPQVFLDGKFFDDSAAAGRVEELRKL